MFDSIQFLSDFNIPYKIERNNWTNIRCPKSGCMDTGFHGGINTQGSYYHCWKCGSSSLEKIIQALLLTSYREAKNIIQDYSVETKLRNVLNKKEKFTPKVSKVILPGEPIQKPHKSYLRGRGFDWKELERDYNIQGTTLSPAEFKYRIIIPIYYKKKLVSFQTRDYTNKQKLRYKNCPLDESIIHYKHTLYGIDDIKGNQIGLVEGPFDKWKMGSGFVASFGTDLTKQQIKLLSGFERVFILFDSEPHTQKKAKNYAKLLSSAKTQVEIIDLELGERDPGDLEEEEVRFFRKELNFL